MLSSIGPNDAVGENFEHEGGGAGLLFGGGYDQGFTFS
jgi:hypothetical protein